MKLAMPYLTLFLSLSSTAFAADVPVSSGAGLGATMTGAVQDPNADAVGSTTPNDLAGQCATDDVKHPRLTAVRSKKLADHI